MKFIDRTRRATEWHRWFAWYPVKVGSTEVVDGYYHKQYVWWEYVEKRKDRYWDWQYREIK